VHCKVQTNSLATFCLSSQSNARQGLRTTLSIAQRKKKKKKEFFSTLRWQQAMAIPCMVPMVPGQISLLRPHPIFAKRKKERKREHTHT
jgi:hypothetical protein